ncbi:MAG: hypothetical protein R3B13_26690 [Polyangiaceae bacterium]
MVRSRILFLCAALCLASGSVSAKPSKADVTLSKKAVKEGKRFEKKQDWEAAREAFQRAVDLTESVDARIGLARAEEKLGHLIESAEQLRIVLEQKKINYVQKRTAKKRLKALEKRIPTVSLELPETFSGEVMVDDESLDATERTQPVAVNPGSHTIKANAEGFKPFEESLELAEGDAKSVRVELVEKKVAPPPKKKKKLEEESSGSTQRTLGYVSLAVGGAGLVVGTAMGLAARSTKNELDKSCQNGVCSEADRELYDKGQTQADIATTGFIVGGVGLGLGTFLLLTASGDEKKTPDADASALQLQPVLGPGHVGLHGRF